MINDAESGNVWRNVDFFFFLTEYLKSFCIETFGFESLYCQLDILYFEVDRKIWRKSFSALLFLTSSLLEKMFEIVSIDKNVAPLRSSLGFQKYRDLKNNLCRIDQLRFD